MTDPKPCPAIALIAVQEVANRQRQELDAVLKLAAQASGIPDGEHWNLNVQTGEWTKHDPTPAE